MIVPHDLLSRETLLSLVEEFITRDTTDYGEKEIALKKKIDDVLRQLEEGSAHITFDEETQTCNINPCNS